MFAWRIELGALRNVQRTDTTPADWVVLDIEFAAELQCWRAIHDLLESVVVNVPERWMEKTWVNGSFGIDDRGNPRRIAARGHGLHLAQVDTKLLHDTPQLCGRLHDEPRIQIGA